MRKPLTIALFLLTGLFNAFGQNLKLTIDSLEAVLVQTKTDSSRVLILTELAANYQFIHQGRAQKLALKAIALAEKIKFSKGKIKALTRLGEIYRGQGDYPQALEKLLNALKLARQTNNLDEEAAILSLAGVVYNNLEEFQQGLNYLLDALFIYNQKGWKLPKSHLPKMEISFIGYLLTNMGFAYAQLGKLDSALYYQNEALALLKLRKPPFSQNAQSLILGRMGEIKQRSGDNRLALKYFRQSLQTATIAGDLLNMSRSRYLIAKVYQKQYPDSSLHYANQAFVDAQKGSESQILLKASTLLSLLYKSGNKLDSAFYYQQIAMATKDSLFGPEKFRRLQLLTLAEQQRIQNLQQEQQDATNQVQRTSLLIVIGVFMLIALMLWRSNRQQQRSNQALSQKSRQIEEQRNTLNQTLIALQSTQAQLIQSEKLASLGELTAGIAHEIQNPLNFVNNFAEVSAEMLDEMHEELEKGDTTEAIAIATDLKTNLEKINHHGQRASSIVKGMLEHSRQSRDVACNVSTDINALADEYLRLAYHGWRAKDNGFNCKIETHFDPDLPMISVIPQDIGRVLLNLINNAFYAVAERSRSTVSQRATTVETLHATSLPYQPTVTIYSKRLENAIEIRVQDNGNGIPDVIKDKIFQPFFTTKPTGQGTGLGLSLAYDIVVKGHGGSIDVSSDEGEGTTFFIHL